MLYFMQVASLFSFFFQQKWCGKGQLNSTTGEASFLHFLISPESRHFNLQSFQTRTRIRVQIQKFSQRGGQWIQSSPLDIPNVSNSFVAEKGDFREQGRLSASRRLCQPQLRWTFLKVAGQSMATTTTMTAGWLTGIGRCSGWSSAA